MTAEARYALRQGTAAEWSSANPILALGEMGFETDTRQVKIGNGTTSWSALTYGFGSVGLGLNMQGMWASGTAYTTGQAVIRNSVLYLAVDPSTGVEPGVTAGWQTDWEIVAITGNIPSGGTTRQALVKKSNADTDIEWTTLREVLTGGTSGQVLEKTGAGDTAYAWVSLPALNFVPLGKVPAYLASNASTASQGAGFATDTYLIGSAITVPNGTLVVGTKYRLKFSVEKTAAGTAAGALNVRLGTAGTTADASICSLAFGAATAAADTGIIEVVIVLRSVGATTAAVAQGMMSITNRLASTGLTNLQKNAVATGPGFDSTLTSLIIGASWNGGASASHTVHLVEAELLIPAS